MAIKSYLHTTWVANGDWGELEPIPDTQAGSINGGSTNYETNQRRCINGKCHYDEEHVVDGVTVHKYSGPKSPLQRLFEGIGVGLPFI